MQKKPSEGSWCLSSKKDSRWNARGTSRSISVVELPRECKQRIEAFREALGEEPDDLEVELVKWDSDERKSC